MADYPAYDKNESAMAGMAYVPFFAINWVVSIFLLFRSDRGSGYARFHAMQSIIISIVILVASLALNALMMGGFFLWKGMDFLNPAKSAASFYSMWSGMMLLSLPSILLSLLMYLFLLFLAYCAYTGRETKVPFVTDMALKRL